MLGCSSSTSRLSPSTIDGNVFFSRCLVPLFFSVGPAEHALKAQS
jgi:hypothetical protein